MALWIGWQLLSHIDTTVRRGILQTQARLFDIMASHRAKRRFERRFELLREAGAASGHVSPPGEMQSPTLLQLADLRIPTSAGGGEHQK